MAGTRSSKETAPSKSTTSAHTTTDKRSQSTEDTKPNNVKPEGKENSAQPLGPPPRPQQGESNSDYFGQGSASNNPSYQSEPNPFEAQFGSTSSDTPGKLLPPLASLTSPSSLLPNETPSWSLRSGPLSPAMLTGPTGTGDYFDPQYPRGFPTPNESGLRTGLTPGGGGSMFPAASPSSLFNQLGMGAPTPNTIDFFKTASNRNGNATTGPTSQPNDVIATTSMDLKMPTTQAPNSFPQNDHDTDAANGLYMLAQSNGVRSTNQFAVPAPSGAVQPPPDQNDNPRATRGKNLTTSMGQNSDSDDSEEVPKPSTRSRGKRNSEPSKPTNRRKVTDSSPRGPKRQKIKKDEEEDEEDDDDDDEDEDDDDISTKDPKKMTDDEKRKNFLERNRVAALKCRQRKKQWLQNLQSKVDLYSQENDALTHTCNMLREHNAQLRSLLVSHKDCSATMSHPMGQQQVMAFLTQQESIPYAAPVSQQQQQQQQQQMPMMMNDGRGPSNGNGIARA